MWTTVHQHVVDFPPWTPTLPLFPLCTSASSSTHLLFFLLLFFFLLLCGVGMPGEALLVKRDDYLGTFDIGLLGWDKVCLIWVFPVSIDWKERSIKVRGEAMLQSQMTMTRIRGERISNNIKVNRSNKPYIRGKKNKRHNQANPTIIRLQVLAKPLTSTTTNQWFPNGALILSRLSSCGSFFRNFYLISNESHWNRTVSDTLFSTPRTYWWDNLQLVKVTDFCPQQWALWSPDHITCVSSMCPHSVAAAAMLLQAPFSTWSLFFIKTT